MERVKEEDKRGVIGLSATTAAWIITMSTLFTGSVLANGLDFSGMVTAAFLGMLVLTSIAFFQAWGGAETGATTAMLASSVFGRIPGAGIALVIAFVLGVGWFGWQLSFLGQTVNAYWPDHFLGQPKTAMVWSAILMIGTTVVGYRALSYLSLFAVPMIVVLSIWGIMAATEQSGGWSAMMASQAKAEPISLLTAIGLVIGNGIIGSLVMPDLSRFGRTPFAGAMATAGGYFFGGMFLILAGAMITYAPVGGESGDLPAAMKELGFGLFGFLILLFAQWTTNNNNLYSGSLAFSSLLGGRKALVVCVMGLLGLAIAIAGVQELFVPLLMLLGAIFPPVCGVMIARFWVGGRRFSEDVVAVDYAALAFAGLGILIASLIDFLPTAVSGFLTAFIAYAIYLLFVKKPN